MEGLVLKEGAIFLADAHENETRRGLWKFLKALERGGDLEPGDPHGWAHQGGESREGESRTKLPPQLFLLGDIFDLLVGEISATHAFAKPYISVLESLAERMEIYYFEGNHDFNLSRLFKRVRIIPQEEQPVKFILHTSEGKNIAFLLAHGDIFLGRFLQFLLGILRKPLLLRGLNFLNRISFNGLSKKILDAQKAKNLGYKIEDFENLARKRYAKYQANGAWVVEGHYHQNLILNAGGVKYFNPASFANEKSFFVVECCQEVKFKEMRGLECLMKIL